MDDGAVRILEFAIPGMDIGRQSLVVNDFTSQSGERVTLLERKRFAQVCFVCDNDLRKFF
jgi:hypothetical protein